MKNVLLIKNSLKNLDLPEKWLNFKNQNKLFGVELNNLSIICSYFNQRQDNFKIFSESKLIFYSKNRDDFIKLNNIDLFYRSNDKFIEDIKNGNLFPVTDSCFCTYDNVKEKLYVFSSCCGSGTIFFTESNNETYFSSHTQFLSNIRKFSISKIGLSEIIRFGANYSSTTIFNELNKIPFANIIVVSSRKLKFIKSYYPKISSLNSNNIDFKVLFEKIINSYELKKASILFSSGVDSTVILESAKSIKNRELLYMRHKHNDFSDNKYLDYIESEGNRIRKFIYNKKIDQFVKTINSYSLPTIDFSILPTEQLIKKSFLYSNQILEGTGGDAWFGFTEINNLNIWNLLSPFYEFSQISSQLLLNLFVKRKKIKLINYLLYIISRLSFLKRPEISQLVSNPYSFSQMKTSKKEWKIIEKTICNQIDSLLNKNSSKFEKFRITDACLVAISQFAAKTGQTSLRVDSNIYYPYFHPLVVSYAMKLKPSQIFSKEFGFKVILKNFLLKKGYPSYYIKRIKVGFQPPLKDILLDKENRDFMNSLLIEKSPCLDKFFSNKFLNSIQDINFIKNCTTIKELYMIWSYLSIKIWIKQFILK